MHSTLNIIGYFGVLAANLLWVSVFIYLLVYKKIQDPKYPEIPKIILKILFVLLIPCIMLICVNSMLWFFDKNILYFSGKNLPDPKNIDFVGWFIRATIAM